MNVGDRVKVIRTGPFRTQRGTVVNIDPKAKEIPIDVLIDGHEESTPYGERELKVL